MYYVAEIRFFDTDVDAEILVRRCFYGDYNNAIKLLNSILDDLKSCDCNCNFSYKMFKCKEVVEVSI